VLSVNQALSIQAHPNRPTAEKLHVEMPDVYKDPNPKPEIAIALSDDFTAFLGFMHLDKIIANIEKLAPAIFDKVSKDSASFLKDCCFYIFNELDHDKERLT